uniref:Kinesin motor domain-containing protein n=1 Tax=Macrostomum lignano TaxID=282301 RepID=A0A1I8FPP3_9PLAT
LSFQKHREHGGGARAANSKSQLLAEKQKFDNSSSRVVAIAVDGGEQSKRRAFDYFICGACIDGRRSRLAFNSGLSAPAGAAK